VKRLAPGSPFLKTRRRAASAASRPWRLRWPLLSLRQWRGMRRRRRHHLPVLAELSELPAAPALPSAAAIQPVQAGQVPRAPMRQRWATTRTPPIPPMWRWAAGPAPAQAAAPGITSRLAITPPRMQWAEVRQQSVPAPRPAARVPTLWATMRCPQALHPSPSAAATAAASPERPPEAISRLRSARRRSPRPGRPTPWRWAMAQRHRLSTASRSVPGQPSITLTASLLAIIRQPQSVRNPAILHMA
jgi:hypothetical protein